MKNFKYLLLILPFMFINNVKADNIIYDYYYFNLDDYNSGKISYLCSDFISNNSSSVYTLDFINSEISTRLKQARDGLYSEKTYPYYFVSLHYYPNSSSTSNYDFSINFVFLTSIVSYTGLDFNPSFDIAKGYNFQYLDGNYIGTWGGSADTSSLYGPFTFIDDKYLYKPFYYYDSNFDFKFDLEDTYIINKDGDLSFTLNKNDIIPTYKSLFIDKTEDNYTEVNLNDYPYIALSLKDYSKTDSFDVNNYVKGQYCLTPVYNYGLTERKEVLSGTQIERCSPYYDDYTPIRTYILKSDLENHSIYYLKAYDTSKENKIKVDTSVFNIHYITDEEKNNPIITINGKKYSTIPYDELTDTATKSEDEGYASGASCAVGDFNCTASMSNSSLSFSDIFTSPIDFLKKIWQGIVNVFTLINYFISILPTTLQYFLYISFMLAIILGLIKIIL